MAWTFQMSMPMTKLCIDTICTNVAMELAMPTAKTMIVAMTTVIVNVNKFEGGRTHNAIQCKSVALRAMIMARETVQPHAGEKSVTLKRIFRT
jgi:hypothetical protein